MATSFGHWQFGNSHTRLVCSGEQSPLPAISLNGLKFAFYAQIGAKYMPSSSSSSSSITTKLEDGKSASEARKQASREAGGEKVRVKEHSKYKRALSRQWEEFVHFHHTSTRTEQPYQQWKFSSASAVCALMSLWLQCAHGWLQTRILRLSPSLTATQTQKGPHC